MAATVATRTPVRARGHHAGLLIPVLLSTAFVAQGLWFATTQSLTYDEPVHVLAGLDAWRHGRFELWNDQPPLGRLLLTAPLLGAPWQLAPLVKPLYGAFWTISVFPNPQALALRTRPVNIALGLALGLLVWATARRMFSEGAANLSLALFVLSPPLIAHFALATVDGALTLGLFAMAVLVVRWRRYQSWPITFALAVIVGAAISTKFSAIPELPLVLVLMLVGTPGSERFPMRLGKAATVLAIVAMTAWASYFFHIGPVTFHNGSLSGPHRRDAVIVPVERPIDATVRLPAPELVRAVGGVAQYNVLGQPSFLLGEVNKTGGWRAYFPVVVALKWPPMVLTIAAVTFVLMLGGALRGSHELGAVMVFPLAFFAVALFSHVNTGDRLILPVYPFLILLCGGFWMVVRNHRLAIPLVGCIVLVQAADCLRYAPDYLSYFNVLVRPDRSYAFLSDSNLDWGQGLIALRRYQREHPTESLHLAYFGSVDPRQYGIDAQPLGEQDRPAGTMIVSATHLSGQYLKNPDAYRWLLKYPRASVLNHTLYVFRVAANADP